MNGYIGYLTLNVRAGILYDLLWRGTAHLENYSNTCLFIYIMKANAGFELNYN